MFLSLFTVGLAAGECNSTITEVYNSPVLFSTGPESWNYFYTKSLRDDRHSIRIYSTRQLSLYKGKGLKCPGINDQVIGTTKPGEVSTFTVDADGDLGFTIFGVYSKEEQSDAVFSVEGKNPNRNDSTKMIVLTSVLLGLSVVFLVVLFVHSILARPRLHYYVQINK